MLDESVLLTLHRGGEGQNVYRMIFSNRVTKVEGYSKNFIFTAESLSLGDDLSYCRSLKLR